ncbi:MAG: selenocysteine-specific translation elongation factor [Chloroflexota bacterium]
MHVIGTAGHVDHGKSTLVQRLTAIDPDRLKEEKQRQLTIDLGFAWFNLNGETVGIVDVPGHRDFIENMLAGVGGIDLVLLIIAADEGVMPQTREHLAIIDLLGIENGIVALTKTDMIDDPDWLDLVTLDVQDALQHTHLVNAPVVPISAKTGDNIPLLIETLQQKLAETPSRHNTGRPALPVDRVFTIKGAGTVVTGTLSGGTITIGDELEIQPGGMRGRVRGLQSYEQAVDVAQPGSRVAVNLAGVDTDEVKRGHVLSVPGAITPTQLIDVHYRHLPDAPQPLKHNAQVKVFIGAAQSQANVRVLNAESLAPGDSGFLQLRLSEPVAVPRDSRFILRAPALRATIGGGMVMDANPAHRHKRFNAEVIARLEKHLQGDPTEIVIMAAEMPLTAEELQARTGLSAADVKKVLFESYHSEELTVLYGNELYIATHRSQQLQQQIEGILLGHHAAHPVRWGILIAELREKSGLSDKHLEALIHHNREIITKSDGLSVRHASHYPDFTPQQLTRIHQLRDVLLQNPYTPPSVAEAVDILGDEELFYGLDDLEEIVIVSKNVFFDRETFQTMLYAVMDMLEADEEVTVQTVRDKFGTTRKYALALLEHMDAQRITRRVGDKRVMRRS